MLFRSLAGKSSRTHKRPDRARRTTALMLERLEDRVLPSTIVWTNRGESGDRFDEVFGGNAALARNVVDAAIDFWERVITDFNQPHADNKISIDISMNDSGFGSGSSAKITFVDYPNPFSPWHGYPAVGRITLGRGGDGDGDGKGDGLGWFIDPTPYDWSEFDDNIVNAFAGDAPPGSPAFNMNDLFTVALLELTHIMGISSLTTLRFHTGGFNTNTGVPDTAEGGGIGKFWVFEGDSITHLMTSYNSGNGGSDMGRPVHSAGPGVPVSFAGQTLLGAEDAGNATFEGSRRYLVPNSLALILHDVYGYSIVPPETFGTFYSFVNAFSEELLIRGGAGDSNDVISVTRSGSNWVVSVDIGNDVPGTGPTDAFVSTFALSSVSSIRIEGGGGNDVIHLDNAGAALDSLTILGGAGNDTITVENTVGAAGAIVIEGQEGNDILNVDSTTPDTPVILQGGAGNDILYVSQLANDLSAVDGGVTIDGGTGTDNLYVYDHANAFNQVYTLTGNTLARSFSATLDYAAVESLVLKASLGISAVNVLGTAATTPVTVFAGGGNDTIQVGNAANSLDALLGPLLIHGEAGADTLTVKDQGITVSKNYNIGATTVSRTGAALIYYWTLEGVTLNANNGTSDIFVYGTATGAPVTINAGEGNDAAYLGSGGNDLDAIDAAVTVNGGNGIDYLWIYDQADAANSTFTLTGTSVTRSLVPAINYGALEGVVVYAGGGGNTINVLGATAGTPMTVYAGAGNDTINVGSASTLDSLLAPLTAHGEAGSDVLYLLDSGTVAGKTFGISASSVSRTGAGLITYLTFEALWVNAGFGNDAFAVAASSATPVTLSAGGGADTLAGPFAANFWHVQANNAGKLNESVSFSSVENLTGGSAGDLVLLNNGVGVSGTIKGGGGTDALDYSGYGTAVDVNLALGSATNVGAGIAGIENVTGGWANDSLTGDAADNGLRGGPGNDTLIGGGGNDIVLGEEGLDLLDGQAGRDLLIGGLAHDYLAGGEDDDILVGGVTTHDSSDSALSALMAEWARPDQTYLQRIGHLRLGGGLNGPFLLNGSTVFDDGVSDDLVGGLGLDWFWAYFAGLTADKILDRAKEEQIN